MTGKPGRGGRPKSAQPKRAYQVKLPLAEADAFDELIRLRSIAATGAPDGLSAATVLRSLVRAAVEAEVSPPKAPRKGTKK